MTLKQGSAKGKSKQTAETAGEHLQTRLREGLLILTLAVSAFLLLALSTYHRADPSWSNLVSTATVQNAAGRLGAWMSDLLLFCVGYLAFVFPIMLCGAAWIFYRHQEHPDDSQHARVSLLVLRTAGFLLVLAAGAGLMHLHWHIKMLELPYQPGGILGELIGGSLLQVLNSVGSSLVLFTLFLIGVTLFTGLSWLRLLEQTGAGFIRCVSSIRTFIKAQDWAAHWNNVKNAVNRVKQKRTKKVTEPVITKVHPVIVKDEKEDKPSALNRLKSVMKKEPKPSEPEAKAAAEKESKIGDDIQKALKRVPKGKKSNVIPKLSLLDTQIVDRAKSLSKQELQEKSREVEECLADFGVAVKVVAVHPGPIVTRYELDLAAGTKVSKVTNLAKDLARSLSVVGVRVVEVIPGKSYIGIELPNEHREMVGLKDVIASRQYESANSALTLALGKDIAGHAVVADLAKMPHLLVAGTTGSGKSVCINAMLLSLLYKSTPKQLRLILIDPKMLELSVYEGIPHLLAPVVTDMKDASSALRWCVVEMERRYRLMSALGVRNIAGYNEKVIKARERGEPLVDPLFPKDAELEPPELQELPQIVVIADEFADMMVVVGKKVETLIARLAQKARAAGIHIILATQRPSVDVITGLIKANIPTRIAFQVSSKIDSRTIIDQPGAEQLLGHGDMLYLPPGSGVPVRVHGAFVDDDEVHRVVKYLKESGEPDYIGDILDDTAGIDTSGYTDAAMSEDNAEQDDLYDAAVEFVTQSRRVSISSVQRRFKIGYNRAARIVEAMEASGVVSSMEGSGNREVLAPPPVGVE